MERRTAAGLLDASSAGVNAQEWGLHMIFLLRLFCLVSIQNITNSEIKKDFIDKKKQVKIIYQWAKKSNLVFCLKQLW